MQEPVYENEKLKDEVARLENEARMIIPGIKALFGFQLVVVFSDRFSKELSDTQQMFHWMALLFSAVSIALALAPAAYHRHAEPHSISVRFAKLTNRWLTWSLAPLIFGYVIDFYLIGVMILPNHLINAIVSTLLFATFAVFWFIYPQYCKRSRRR